MKTPTFAQPDSGGGRRATQLASALAVLAVLLAPPQAAAVGAEDTSFFGRTPSGGLVRMDFLTDPESWAGEGSVYGSRSVAALSFCAAVAGSDAGDELHCASTRGDTPAVTYRALPAGDDAPAFDAPTPEGAAYRDIAREAKLGRGDRRGDATLVRLYACSKGCTDALPRQLFEVAFYD